MKTFLPFNPKRTKQLSFWDTEVLLLRRGIILPLQKTGTYLIHCNMTDKN